MATNELVETGKVFAVFQNAQIVNIGKNQMTVRLLRATKLRPFIPSGKDYGLAQTFFEALGFEKIYSDNGLSIFRIGELEFFLQNFHDEGFQSNFMVELQVEDLDGWWAKIQKIVQGDAFPVKVKEPTFYPWGKREVHLIDPAGVCWHISEMVQSSPPATN